MESEGRAGCGPVISNIYAEREKGRAPESRKDKGGKGNREVEKKSDRKRAEAGKKKSGEKDHKHGGIAWIFGRNQKGGRRKGATKRRFSKDAEDALCPRTVEGAKPGREKGRVDKRGGKSQERGGACTFGRVIGMGGPGSCTRGRGKEVGRGLSNGLETGQPCLRTQ